MSYNLFSVYQPRQPRFNHKWIILGIIIILVLIWIRWARAETPPANLWKGIIAEACGEGKIGLYAVACVYRNRLEKGIPLGCIALKRKDLDQFVQRQGLLYEKMAKEIVRSVFGNPWLDITGGATHYENIECFGTPWWIKNMIKTIKIKSHTFYKERG